MQFAHTGHIPEMVQVIFYAMVLNEAAELGLSSRFATDCMMLDLPELKWDIMEHLDFIHRIHLHLQPPALNLHLLQVRRMAKTKSTPMMTSPDELLAEDTIESNPLSVPMSSGPAAEVVSKNTSSSSDSTPFYSSDGPPRTSSSEEASTSSSPYDGPVTPGRSVLKKRGHAPVESIAEIVAERPEFPEALTRTNP
ncbi:hypothetical protein Cgig2_006284 [Carnegiea gigantea]|uniref:Uncharacterized protein n=1 Tax=Carnegiea gigantea TaxID=171969 RepID=A0A9Q1JPK9_9CARY|nr:hypothetical protein Cgig2_006284 [Carnegiea gigantea]